MTTAFNIGTAMVVINVLLRVLNRRLLLLVALTMVFGLFCWAMYLGSWIQFAIAGAFGITIFLPILWSERKQEVSGGQETS